MFAKSMKVIECQQEARELISALNKSNGIHPDFS